MSIIAIDVDGVLADFVGYMLNIYNKEIAIPQNKTPLYHYSATQPIDVLLDTEDFIKVRGIAESQNGIEQLPTYDGAKEFIKGLNRGHYVVFATSPYWKYKNWVWERHAWLKSTFNCDDNRIFFMQDKSLLAGDILIDDYPKHLDAWAKTGRTCIKVVRPWNEKINCAGIPAENFEEIQLIIDHLPTT